MNLSAFSDGTPSNPQSTTIPPQQERPEQEFWSRYFDFYDTLNESLLYTRMIQSNIDLLDPSPEDFILDAGTGTGNVAQGLAGRCSRVIGIDFSQAALAKCRSKMPDGDFRFGDLTQRLDFADATFDKAVSCNVIYTLTPKGQHNAVAELFRVLKPGGTVVITVFGAGFRALTVYRETFRLQRKQSGLWPTLKLAARYSIATARILYYVARIRHQTKAGKYTFFTPAGLRQLVESAGFQVKLVEATFASQCLIIQGQKPQLSARPLECREGKDVK